MKDAMPEPTWCMFCEDQPAVGRMLMVYESTQDVVPMNPDAAPMASCSHCGYRFTDVEAARSPEGRKGVFQFEHDDYAAVADQATQLAASLRCAVCSAPAPCTEAAMTKALRLWPHVVEDLGQYLRPTCGSCTEQGLCPCCGEAEHEDDGIEP